MSNDNGSGSGETPEVFWEPGKPLPIYAILDGVEVVMILRSEYNALTNRLRPSGKSHRLSAIDKAPDIRRFILERLGTEDVEHIRQAAIERFGADRVPSKSAVGRFVIKTRAAGPISHRK